MSWQEELRDLDDELADGLISATEYRRRSEDLIAAASATPARPAARSAPRTTATGQGPTEPGTTGRPREPPATAPEPRRPEAGEPPAEAESPKPEPESPTRHEPQADQAEPARQAAKPAARPTFAPPRRDPVDEAFAPGRQTPHRRSRRLSPRLAAGVAVLVLAAVAVWLFGFGPATSGTGRATSGTASAAPVRIPHGLAAKLDSLPGRRVTGRDTVPVGKLAGLGICSADRAAALRANGVTLVLYLTSVQDGKAFSVTVVPHRGRTPAGTTATNVLATQRGHEFAESGRMSLPRGVTVLTRTGDAGTRLRAVYTAGTDTVVVGAASPHSAHGVVTEFRHLATHVTDVLAPH